MQQHLTCNDIADSLHFLEVTVKIYWLYTTGDIIYYNLFKKKELNFVSCLRYNFGSLMDYLHTL